MTPTATKPMCTINTRICTPLTTAHEIGHAAGLEDQYVDDHNLMFRTDKRISYGLKVDQVVQIIGSSFAY